jgi:hypothetical protein
MRAGWFAPIAATAWVVFTLGAAPASAQSLGGLYVNSASLQSQVDALDTAAQASKTLQPYDDQLANLATFAQQEDLAVATRDVAARDLEMATLLATPGDKRASALIAHTCARLKVQALNADCQDPAYLRSFVGLAYTLPVDLAAVASQTNLVSSDINDLVAEFPGQTAPSCTNADALMKAAPAGSALYLKLHTLSTDCQALTKLNEPLATIKGFIEDSTSGNTPENLGDTVAAAADADEAAQAKVLGGGDLTALKAEIAQVQKVASDKTDLGSLDDLETSIQAFGTSIQKDLANVDPVLQVANLALLQKSLGDSLAQVSGGIACAGAPSCQGQQVKGVASQSSATVGFLNAIAGVADASAGRGSQAQWLLAAQAIVAAIKADAQLQADADKADAAAADLRFKLSVREVSMLAATLLIARGEPLAAKGQPEAVEGPNLCGDADPFICALPYDVESWNSGRIPADILSWRQIQRFRMLTVQRQRLVAQEQRGILLAATATLKAYGDGGIQPATIAQLLNAAGVIAIAAK